MPVLTEFKLSQCLRATLEFAELVFFLFERLVLIRAESSITLIEFDAAVVSRINQS